MIRVGDLVRDTHQVLGTVTYVRYAAGTTPLELTVCNGPSMFDQIHPEPSTITVVP